MEHLLRHATVGVTLRQRLKFLLGLKRRVEKVAQGCLEDPMLQGLFATPLGFGRTVSNTFGTRLKLDYNGRSHNLTKKTIQKCTFFFLKKSVPDRPVWTKAMAGQLSCLKAWRWVSSWPRPSAHPSQGWKSRAAAQFGAVATPRCVN